MGHLHSKKSQYFLLKLIRLNTQMSVIKTILVRHDQYDRTDFKKVRP